MTQHYSDPDRENDDYALPDIEVWESEIWEIECNRGCGITEINSETIDAEVYCPSCDSSASATKTDRVGWFYWYGFPGCLPDSDPMGPFDTEKAALEDARDGVE